MTALLVAVGFALGSIPFGVLVARRLGTDIRKHGSGNIGATNVARVLGPAPGAIVLALDALKGALAVALALHFEATPWLVTATGFAAVVGHCFSPLLGGKGGKGVATAFGVFLVLAPGVALTTLPVFAIVVVVGRVPALGSLTAAFAIAARLVWRGDLPLAALAVAIALLLVYTHRGNLAKLTRSR